MQRLVIILVSCSTSLLAQSVSDTIKQLVADVDTLKAAATVNGISAPTVQQVAIENAGTTVAKIGSDNNRNGSFSLSSGAGRIAHELRVFANGASYHAYDAAGNEVVDLGAGRTGGILNLYDESGKNSLSFLGASASGSGVLEINGNTGILMHRFATDGVKGGYYNIFNVDSKRVVAAGAVDQNAGGALWLYDASGKNLLSVLGADVDGFAQLKTFGGTLGKSVTSLLGTGADGAGQFNLYTANGGVAHEFGTNETNGGYYNTYNGDHKRILTFGTSVQNGGGLLLLYDPSGKKTIASMGVGPSGDGLLLINGQQVRDYAEMFDIADRSSLIPGSVVAASPDGNGVVAARSPYDPTVVGVISGGGDYHSGTIIGARTDGTTDFPVAVAGQVFVRINNEGGPVRVGDLLVASSTPGVAMRGTDHERLDGAVVGKALEAFSSSGEGLIRMLVMNR